MRKVLHVYIDKLLSNRAKHRFQKIFWAKYEAGGAYRGGAYIKKAFTLKVETFAGRNFRDFANFLVVRESLYPRNRTFEFIREKSMKKGTKNGKNGTKLRKYR